MAEKTKKQTQYFYSLGRRKTAIASVRLFPEAGESTVNDKALNAYYPLNHEQVQMWKPIEVVGQQAGDFHITAKVKGSGKTAQLEAIRLGMARALVEMNPEFKKPLKQAGMLTRDPRMVERKKPGLHKARKAEQYSKR